jgi:uncharacterized protein YbjT (DUF2867 family)
MILLTGATGTIGRELVAPTAAELTGRPPQPFRDWAIRHAAALR